MSEKFQYQIVNIDLEKEEIDYLQLFVFEKQIYFTFWWRTIPLGDLYYHYNKNAKKEDMWPLVKKIILPTIHSYIQKRGIENSFVIDSDTLTLKEIKTILQLVFQQPVRSVIPNEVDISLIICTRNRSFQLNKCLENLFNLNCLPKEIIVVDNSPSDENTKIVAERFPVIYVREDLPGLDIARNTGARLAKCSIIAYSDDDVMFTKNWCYEIWQTFIDNKTDAMTGLIFASSLDTESQVIFEKHWSFNRGYIDKLYDKSFLEMHAPRVWDIGAGANMAFRKEALERVNYFDERLDAGAAGCSGDSELWFRLLLTGSTIAYNPRAVVFHNHRSDMASLKNQIYYYMRGHAASLMIQHALNKQSGYIKYLSKDLPKYYLWLLRKGFPLYRGRHATLINEIKGLMSGVVYYYRNKTRNISLNDKTH